MLAYKFIQAKDNIIKPVIIFKTHNKHFFYCGVANCWHLKLATNFHVLQQLIGNNINLEKHRCVPKTKVSQWTPGMVLIQAPFMKEKNKELKPPREK